VSGFEPLTVRLQEAWPGAFRSLPARMPHKSAIAAPKTRGFPGDPFHDPFHGAVDCLGRSPTCGLTSATVGPVVACGGDGLPRLGLSRRVPFTDRFTNRVPDLGFLVLLGCRVYASDWGVRVADQASTSATRQP
jgi:hypothetical protein